MVPVDEKTSKRGEKEGLEGKRVSALGEERVDRG